MDNEIFPTHELQHLHPGMISLVSKLNHVKGPQINIENLHFDLSTNNIFQKVKPIFNLSLPVRISFWIHFRQEMRQWKKNLLQTFFSDLGGLILPSWAGWLRVFIVKRKGMKRRLIDANIRESIKNNLLKRICPTLQWSSSWKLNLIIECYNLLMLIAKFYF